MLRNSALFLYLVLLSLNACTYELWTHKPVKIIYKENVDQILISQDKQQIVFISPKYHYIFKSNPQLIQTLDAPFRVKLTASFSDFAMVDDESITGNFTLNIKTPLAVAELADAKMIGFLETSPNNLQLNISLKGERYSAGGTKMPIGKTQVLNNKYSVSVSSEEGISTLDKIRATPIALVGDALVIGLIPLVPVGMIVKSFEK